MRGRRLNFKPRCRPGNRVGGGEPAECEIGKKGSGGLRIRGDRDLTTPDNARTRARATLPQVPADMKLMTSRLARQGWQIEGRDADGANAAFVNRRCRRWRPGAWRRLKSRPSAVKCGRFRRQASLRTEREKGACPGKARRAVMRAGNAPKSERKRVRATKSRRRTRCRAESPRRHAIKPRQCTRRTSPPCCSHALVWIYRSHRRTLVKEKPGP